MLSPAPHPATLTDEELRKQCDINRLRRSGPGGQHRNKVETAVVFTHLPTGVQAEANERRSQAQNAARGLHRLRVRLAIEVRTAPNPSISGVWAERAARGPLRVSPEHTDFPRLLAEALDQLAACEWDDRIAAATLGVSRSALVRLLRSEPAALEMLNAARREQNLGPLR